ncbi:hypothetical protein MMF93_31330 [Streptomyces tubbatahanensis]|uniref:Uncharacterized protein n=1 Tax=Streptomyces tubbatahanensis TaxID=2923272 RepID=A0ABY3Y1G7_9ACTN|nr:hypothetical protein [Streptomyces tubbatahanensis]UNT00462.1 hypothetical protein MMF93_31330 [Streptomyces tubbatahanensis]
MIHLHTRDAVEEYLRVRADLFWAMCTDHHNGVAAQEIARTAAGAYSPPVIVEYLSCVALRDDARAALRRAGLHRCVGVRSTGAGGGPRAALLAATRDPAELEDEERRTLPERVTTALGNAGIHLEIRDHTALTAVLHGGEEVRIRRARHRAA